MKKRLLQELDDLLQSVEFTHNAFQHVFQHAGSGMTLTDENGTILEVNPAFSAVTGYTHNEAIGKNPNILRSFYHDNKFYDDLWEKIKTIGYFESKIWNRRKTGEAYPEILTIQRIINPKTNTTYYLAVFSELHTLGSNIEAIDLSYYDALTQIANRTLLQEHLKDTTCNIQRATAKKKILILAHTN